VALDPYTEASLAGTATVRRIIAIASTELETINTASTYTTRDSFAPSYPSNRAYSFPYSNSLLNQCLTLGVFVFALYNRTDLVVQ